MSEQWLSIVEYARAYNVSDMTVRRRIRNGKLNAVLKDGKYFIPVLNQIQATRNPPKQTAMMQPSGHGNLPSEYQTPIAKERPQRINMEQPVQQMASSISPISTRQVVQKGRVEVSLSGVIPQNISQPLQSEEDVSLAARNLLGFCEAMAQRLEKSEKSIRREYEAKISELVMSNKSKDIEINQIKQQVEDLQLLVNIIDPNK